MLNFHPWASSNSSQWFSNSYETCLLLHAPILSTIHMEASKSQMHPLGGYFYPFHFIFFIFLKSVLNLSYLSQNLSSLVIIECIEFPSKSHKLSSSLFLFHGSYSPLPIQIPWLIIFSLTPHHPAITLHYPCVRICMMPSVWGFQSPKGSTSFQVPS